MNISNNRSGQIEVIDKVTQKRGTLDLSKYDIGFLQSLMIRDPNAGNTLIKVIFQDKKEYEVPLKNLVILYQFTGNTKIAIQLVVGNNTIH